MSNPIYLAANDKKDGIVTRRKKHHVPYEKSGVELIADERARQKLIEGWTPEHDDEHTGAQMAVAAACYALPARQRSLEDAHIEMDAARGLSDPPMPYAVKVRVPKLWPWDPEWWKPEPRDRVRELVKAGALIAAEIDRLQRAG